MRKILSVVLVAVIAATASAVPAFAQDFKVIVNSANSTSDLPAAVAAKIFLKETTKFPNGSAATPVDQGKASPVRAAFSKSVIGRPVSAVESYWQQIFSGKEVPPAAKSSDDDVVAFVKGNPGAIGYVSAGASTAGVKVIDVK